MDEKTALHGMVSSLHENARDLGRELDWFAALLDLRLKGYFGKENTGASVFDLPPPDLGESRSHYAEFVRHYELSVSERVVLLLALIPHLRPQLLDPLWIKNEMTERGFTEFGGLHAATHGGFIPTGETAAFLLAGEDLAFRFELSRLFEGDHFFSRHQVLSLSPVAGNEPPLSGALVLSRECRYWLTTGVEPRPVFNSEFPARRIETDLRWDDLILPASTRDQLEEIKHWILYGQQLLHDWGMGRKLRPGFTSLFYGPPGTGKTLSASLLGKECGRDVYKIDLSMIVSKYIGETEKNLSKVFDAAEHKQWILFFDEADALFGKRTRVDDSHDRYANQEISFLLQRIEEFSGVVILASNLKGNIDEAFLRRFQSVIYFPMPKPDERLRIWENAFSSKSVLDGNVHLPRIAEKYDLSGGTIMNVVRYSSLKALSRRQETILLEDMEEGIRREFLKEGRTV